MSQELGILQTVVVESPDPNMYVMAMYRRNVLLRQIGQNHMIMHDNVR